MTRPQMIIGNVGGRNFLLPRETVTSTIVVLGGKGMGKTNLGGVLVEEVDAQGDRWCAIDPLGVWWGLRHSLDGKGPGIECVILGGVHGDIPIEPTGGAVAADLVVDERANVILDISRKPNGEMWGMGERIRFAKDFAKRLFQRQGELLDGHRREPIFVQLDEAATFIPQMFPSGNVDMAECISAWQTLVEWGRNVGIGVGLLTQRSARINKSVTEIADALFSFRIVGPNSLKAVTDWLGEHVDKEKVREHVQTLRSLDRGRCLIVSPGWLKFEGVVDIRLRHTFDSSATPKPGERQQRVTGKAAKPDLAAYQERMKETIERAKENDPRALKAQVQQLRAELLKKQSAISHQPSAVSRSQPALSGAKGPTANDPQLKQTIRAQDAALKSMRALIEEAMKITAKINAIGFDGAEVKPEEIQAAVEKAAAEVGRIAAGKLAMKRRELEALKAEVNRLLLKLNARLGDEKLTIAVDVVKNEPVSVRTSSPAPIARHRMEVSREADASGLKSSHIRVLSSLAELLDCTGAESVPKEQLAAWSGYSPTGGGYNNIVGALRTAGMVDYPVNGYVSITAAGRQLAQPQDVPVSNARMLERAKQVLKGPEAKIFERVHADYPESVTKEQIAADTGYTAGGGGFNNYLGRMRTLGFVTYPATGAVRCADWMFIEKKAEAAGA